MANCGIRDVKHLGYATTVLFTMGCEYVTDFRRLAM
jgi:hypothetical protein